MGTLSALDVAEYFLAQESEECGDTISNLKVQKLLYYAQGFHLAMYDKPLFSEAIVRWNLGPVVEEVYHAYKSFGAGAITLAQPLDYSKYSEDLREFLDEIYQVFGQFSAWMLSNMTHNEPPWKDALTNERISHDALKAYFTTQLV